MYDVLYPSLNGRSDPAWSHSVDADPQADELWRFTDPVARAVYARDGKLDHLSADIQAYVTVHGRWASDELEYDLEIQRLVSAGVLRPKGAFGHLSPHPTVYRATVAGVLEIARQKYHFSAAQDVVFVPWLERVCCPGLTGPVRIGRLQSIQTWCLSEEAFPRVSMLCERALAILQQTLPSRSQGIATRGQP